MSPVPDLDPYSGLSVQQKMHVQHPGTTTGSSGPHWGKKEQTVFGYVPLLTGIEVSISLRIPASVGNLVSCVQADGNDSMSSALFG